MASAENARVNGVELELRRHDLRHEPAEAMPTVAANLLVPLLLLWARQLSRVPKRPQQVIASGLLVHEVDAIAAALAPLGLYERDRRRRGEWAAALFASPRVDKAGPPNSGHAADAAPGASADPSRDAAICARRR
jgi:ribosomal protein L11 methylase PrmA